MGAGGSARHEAQRARERAARPQRRAEMFDKGADGEARTARALSRLGRDWVVLHDVHWPGRRLETIDHVVVGPGGIFVVDTRSWPGRLSLDGAVLRQDGRSRERTVAAAADAAAAVAELAPAYAGLVRPVLCFARDDELSGWGGDVLVCSTSNVRRMLTSCPPVLVRGRAAEVAARFDRQMRSASEPRPGVTAATPAAFPSAALLRPAPVPPPRARRRGARALTRVAAVTALAVGGVVVAPAALPSLGDKVAKLVTNQLAPETDECVDQVDQPREQQARDGASRATGAAAAPARCGQR